MHIDSPAPGLDTAITASIRGHAERNFHRPRNITDSSATVHGVVAGLRLLGLDWVGAGHSHQLTFKGAVTWATAMWRVLGGFTANLLIAGESIELPPLGPHFIGGLDNWKLAWGLAWASRDEELVGALLNAAAVPLTPRPGVTRPAYFTAFVDSFVQFQIQRPGWVEACEEAVRLASPEVAGADYPYTQDAHTLVGLMIAFQHLDDVEAFDRALVAALIAHRDKQIRFAPPDDFIGLIAWPILGLAARAHDLGVPFTTTSDYLPPAILLNRFG